jgi:hypothetical protein
MRCLYDPHLKKIICNNWRTKYSFIKA